MAVIMTTRGEEIVVDDADFEALNVRKWQVSADGYARRSQRVGPRKEGRKLPIVMHRLIMGLSFGDGLEVDHINGNRLDNRRANLRVCLKRENARNRPTHRNNRLGVKGVSAHGKKFRSEIQIDKRRIYLGLHETAELAAEFYSLAADMVHGEFANCR